MTDAKESIRQMIDKYGKDVEELCRYLEWLESKKGEDVGGRYDPGEGKKSTTISVPTYDSTLLAFIKKARNTAFMNRNYVYVYSRLRIRTAEDEHKVIDNCEIMDMETLGAILSSYCMRGMTKAYVWTEGVKNGVFWHVISRMKELVDHWSS